MFPEWLNFCIFNLLFASTLVLLFESSIERFTMWLLFNFLKREDHFKLLIIATFTFISGTELKLNRISAQPNK